MTIVSIVIGLSIAVGATSLLAGVGGDKDTTKSTSKSKVPGKGHKKTHKSTQ